MVATSVATQVEEEGFAVIPACLDDGTVQALRKRFDENARPARNLLSDPEIRRLAQARVVRDISELVLGPECFAVRGILFNKTASANWKVVWHQDLTISVREYRDIRGFGPWTTKAGILHVQPPPDVLSGMLAIRLHLDCSELENGPLRLIPGSHRHGRLSVEELRRVDKEKAVVCTVPTGGALVMRPLVVHASSSCIAPKPRRVMHLEFAANELPGGLDWHDRA